jgi:hypothetical protein
LFDEEEEVDDFLLVDWDEEEEEPLGSSPSRMIKRTSFH